MDTRVTLKSKLSSLQKPTSIADFLNIIPDLEEITEDADDAHIVILDFVKRLVNYVNYYADSPLTNAQLEAIAYVTGYVDRSLPDYQKINKRDNEPYTKSCFLSNEKDLKFICFNKSIIALQLVARIIEPKRIDQREELICGVSALMQSLVRDEPLIYAEFSTDLAQFGQAILRVSDAVQGLKVAITDQKIFKRLARTKKMALLSMSEEDHQRDVIEDADFISLIGLKHCVSAWIGYQEDSGTIKKSAFGVTLSSEITAWLNSIGYKYVHGLNLSSKNNISIIQKLLADGHACILQTTTDLIALIQAAENGLEADIGGYYPQLLKGHFVSLSEIEFDGTHITLSLISWGVESKKVKINYSDFEKNKGFGHFIFGITPSRLALLEKKANLQSYGDRPAPYLYMRQVKRAILSEDWILTDELPQNKLHQIGDAVAVPHVLMTFLDFIERAYLHPANKSWFLLSRELQNSINDFSRKISALDGSAYTKDKMYLFCRQFLNIDIIKERKAAVELVLVGDEPNKLAVIASKYQDILALLQAIKLCLNDKQVGIAFELIMANQSWLNNIERAKCQRLLDVYGISQLIADAMEVNGNASVTFLTYALDFSSDLVFPLKLKALKLLIKELAKKPDCSDHVAELKNKYSDMFNDNAEEIEQYMDMLLKENAPIKINIEVMGRYSRLVALSVPPSLTYQQIKPLFIKHIQATGELRYRFFAKMLNVEDIMFFYNSPEMSDNVIVSSDNATYHISCQIKDYRRLVLLAEAFVDPFSAKKREGIMADLVRCATIREIEAVSTYNPAWEGEGLVANIFASALLMKLVKNIEYLSNILTLYGDQNIRLLNLLVNHATPHSSSDIQDVIIESSIENQSLHDKCDEIDNDYSKLDNIDSARMMWAEGFEALIQLANRRRLLLEKCNIVAKPELLDKNSTLFNHLKEATLEGDFDKLESLTEALITYFQLPIQFIAGQVAPRYYGIFSFKIGAHREASIENNKYI